MTWYDNLDTDGDGVPHSAACQAHDAAEVTPRSCEDEDYQPPEE